MKTGYEKILSANLVQIYIESKANIANLRGFEGIDLKTLKDLFVKMQQELNKRVARDVHLSEVLAWASKRDKEEFIALIRYTIVNPRCWKQIAK